MVMRLPCVLLAAGAVGMLGTACSGTECYCQQGFRSTELSVSSVEECYALSESPEYDACYPAEFAASITSPLGAATGSRAAGDSARLWDSTLAVRAW
jgi:hypothetical protein